MTILARRNHFPHFGACDETKLKHTRCGAAALARKIARISEAQK